MTKRMFLTACRRAGLTVRTSADGETVESIPVVWHHAAQDRTTGLIRARNPFMLHVVLTRKGVGWRLVTRTGMHSVPLQRAAVLPTRNELCRFLWRRDRKALMARVRAQRQAERPSRVRIWGEG